MAAYRERHDITDTTTPAGDAGSSWTQRHDHRHATQAVENAQQLAGIPADQPVHPQVEQHDQHAAGPDWSL